MKKSSVYNPFRFPYKLSPVQALLTASAQGCYLRMPKSSYLVIRIKVIINLIMIMKSFNRLEALAHCDSYSSFNDETAPHSALVVRIQPLTMNSYLRPS